jgi:adenine-specific DNA-methyltransferase
MNDLPKVATASESIEHESLQKLRAVFPEFVKENSIDFDALKAFFEKEGMLSSEKYGLSWAGKSRAFQAIRTPATGTLVPQKEESKNWDDTENLFIEGDNLEVLKLLQKHYREKIKMIYIDPPYNTGKDFVYKDNFTQGVADYYEQTGQTQGGIKMSTNTEKNGRYHSDWLTMMYPRLFLACNLLKEDGVIFVSIDDNEVANLRLIMDEIFGEENFVGEFIVVRAEGGGLANQYIKGHDYLVVYARNIQEFEPLKKPKDIRGKIIEKDGKQYWIEEDWLRKEFGKYGTLLYEEIEQVKGLEKKKEIDAGLENGEYQLLEKKRGQHIVGRLRLIEEDGSKFYSILKHLSADGNEDLESLNLKKYFDFPKPVSLLKTLISGATFFSKNDSDIILDFFAGSGTTAHAVMDLNAEDGGNRKWICVQLPEATEEDSEAYKAGYKTIADISRERIRRAGRKIGEGDIGFKSYKLTSSNYRIWNELTNEDEIDAILNQSKLFTEKPLVDDYNSEELLYEILLKEGFDLSSTFIPVDKDSTNLPWDYYIVEDKAVAGESLKSMIVTFADKIFQKDLENPKIKAFAYFICLDSALDDTTKVNVGRNINIKTI